ncbi:MAG: DNA-directed RNA polymerase subunit alpha [Candidatus Aerophobetes bacterium]|nr:DNA-directed RNA polymerase subunit alpha [Candidatus Aerophobetes bacterium]
MRELVRLQEIRVEKESFSDKYEKFIIEPLEKGYGVTLGNAFRRVLLSSIPGVAITSVKIEGVSHEFSTIPGVKEDVLEIIQNLKQIRGRLFGRQEKKVRIDVRGPLDLKASHFQANEKIKIVNPDLHIATLNDKKTHLTMEVTLAEGRGYVEAEENKKPDQPLGTIPIDSIFTPIKKVNYEVKPTRIGRKGNYDCLILEIFADGTIKPEEVLKEAAKILDRYLKLFITEEARREKTKEDEFLEQGIEEIGLNTVSLNALKSYGIRKIRDLLKKNARELLKIENFGKKSLEKVRKRLTEHNLSLAEEIKNETQKKR